MNIEIKDSERNVYLKQFYDGILYGPLESSVEKSRPWIKYYTVEELANPIVYRTMYEDLIYYTQNNLDCESSTYLGNHVTYKDFIENINITASAFEQNNVKKGDVVALLSVSLPETLCTIYALSKIGATVQVIDPRVNKNLISQYLQDSKAKIAVVVDAFNDKVISISDETNLEQIISISPLNSANSESNKVKLGRVINVYKPILSKLKMLTKNIRFRTWNDFLNDSNGKSTTVTYDEDAIAAIEYTSGSTGSPKGVMLSNKSFNSLVYSQKQVYISVPGDRFLLIMPPFIAYGLVVGIHVMLCQNQNLQVIPNFSIQKCPDMLIDLIKKYQPKVIMGVPNFLTYIMETKEDMSCIRKIIVGGDSLNSELQKKAITQFEDKGYNIDIMVGWGMTEIASCGTFTKENAPIKLGSAGIPLSKNVIKILPYNEDNVYDINANGLAVNQKGMLFFSSPSRMKGYYKRPELTEETILTDNEGTKWIKTGDLAWVDSDGYIFFEGRAKRIVVRPDGHNIPGEYIETIANSYDQVKSAVVVGVKSTNYPHGSYAGLCIERNNDSNMTDDELLTIIDKMCCEKLQPRDRVKYYIITNIPYTANNKVDYDKLQIAVNQLIQELEINEDNRESFFILEGQVLEQKKKSTKTLKRIFKTKR